MPFRLKNAGATYQRLVYTMFADLINYIMEVYIDDMIVKSLKENDHINHLIQAFSVLRKYNMKLNPTKCSFGVTFGKFSGYPVAKRGIKADPWQIKAVKNIQSPRRVKDVQKLTCRLADLNKFISRYSDKRRPIFDTLQKGKQFEWTSECESALADLKLYLKLAPLLSKPKPGEPLIIYLSVSTNSLSEVLVREEKGHQHSVYYLNRSMLDIEHRYPQLKKLALALVMASTKLTPYFQSHPITVVTAFSLKSILFKPNLSGHLAKWMVELGKYRLNFKPWTIIKSQVLADFIADFSVD